MNNYRNKQQGVVLVIALIALVAISLAGVALMRSVDTSNVVSGNIAFNEAAIQVADVGAELALTELNSQAFVGKAYYYPQLSQGALPTTWSASKPVPLPGETANTASYAVVYMIERMCSDSQAATFGNCKSANLTAINGVDSNGNTVAIGWHGQLFYRITVRVTGPRNTRATSQYFHPGGVIVQ